MTRAIRKYKPSPLKPVHVLDQRGRVQIQRFRLFSDEPRQPGQNITSRTFTRDLWEEGYQEWLRGPGRGVGTRPEYAVYRWLIQHGFEPDVDFTYQGSLMGGRRELGGIVADFIIENQNPRIIIRVQGENWHFGDPAIEARDRLQKVQLESMGFVVVDVTGTDAIRRTNPAMEQALRGLQLF